MREIIYATVVLAYSGLALSMLQACSYYWHRLRNIRCMWLKNLRFNWQSSDPMRLKVHELMTKRSLHRARLGSAAFSHISMVYLLLTLAQMHNDGEVFRNDEAAWKAVTEWELVTAVILLWATRLSISFPWVVTSWTLDLLVALIIARQVVREILVPDIMLHERYYIHYIGSQRLVFLFLLGNVKASFAINVAYSICNFAIYFSNFGWNDYHHVYEFLSLILLLFMAWIFHTWTYSEARATLEAKMLRRSEATMHRLLSAMCDAVVHLGPDYLIRYPAPKLEVLLLKSKTRTSLQGTPFTDLFLDGSERDRFDHFLSSITDESPRRELADNALNSTLADQENMACTFHSHMRDANDTKVSVQIFHGSCLDIDEQVCHVVGIREEQETASRAHAMERAASADGSLAPLWEHCRMPNPEMERESDCSSLSISEVAGEVAVWVDTSTPLYKVVRYTAGFSELCGPSAEGIELLQWMRGSQQSHVFRKWVQECFNDHMNEGLDDDKCVIHMKLSPPHFRRFKLSVVATIELAEIEVTGDADSGASEHIIMLFKFSRISWIQARAAARKLHAQGSTDRRAAIVSI